MKSRSLLSGISFTALACCVAVPAFHAAAQSSAPVAPAPSSGTTVALAAEGNTLPMAMQDSTQPSPGTESTAQQNTPQQKTQQGETTQGDKRRQSPQGDTQTNGATAQSPGAGNTEATLSRPAGNTAGTVEGVGRTTFHGITVYGNIDVGAQYQVHGATYNDDAPQTGLQ